MADFRPGRVDFKPERADFRPERERTDAHRNKRKSPCVLQDIVPFGAAALLPITYNHKHTKQGNGYR